MLERLSPSQEQAIATLVEAVDQYLAMLRMCCNEAPVTESVYGSLKPAELGPVLTELKAALETAEEECGPQVPFKAILMAGPGVSRLPADGSIRPFLSEQTAEEIRQLYKKDSAPEANRCADWNLSTDRASIKKMELAKEAMSRSLGAGRTAERSGSTQAVPTEDSDTGEREGVDSPRAWSPPTGYIGVFAIMSDAEFRKNGKNPPRTTLQGWEESKPHNGKPVKKVKAPDSQEVFFPKEWVRDCIKEWNPRQRNTPT